MPPHAIRRPPPELLRTPVTTAIALGSVLVTILTNTGDSIDPMRLDGRAFWSEPWRLLTSVLPHAGVLHLLFNLWGLWAIGRVIEEEWGSSRTLLLTVFLAAGSGAAQLGFAGIDGIGLSGVGYGHFGFWWALSRWSHRYGNILDPSITKSYVSWFFVCIALTEFGVLRIGNVAHGAGAVLGGLVGYAVARHGRRSVAAWALAGLAFVASLTAAATTRTVSEFAQAERLMRTDPEQAVTYLKGITVHRPGELRAWYLLAHALEQMERFKEAATELERALGHIPESEGELRRPVQDWREELMRRHEQRERERERLLHPGSQPETR